MSSVVNRSKRKNAGKRMAILGAKMAEEDEAFWSHETWADDDDSGNESFHESDEDSALQKDVFDSDFNDSESDNEDEEVAAGEAEERELRKSERASKRSNAHAGHKRGRRGFPGGLKRVVGEGSNAGIVLNLPPESYDSLAYSQSIAAARKSALSPLMPTLQSTGFQSAVAAAVTDTKAEPGNANLLAQSAVAPPPPPPLPIQPPLTMTVPTIKAKAKAKPAPVRKQTRSMKVSLRERRSTHGARKLRGRGADSTTTTAITTTTQARSKPQSGSASDSTSRAAKRKKYAQEELLLEAVHETEPENRRWLHGRKRVQDQHDRDKDSNVLRDRHRGKKVIQKFHSRRGYLITLTFPEMDAVPEILTRRHELSTKQSQPQQPPPILGDGEKKETSQVSPVTSSSIPQQHQHHSSRCVITGKTGKYKDPLTKYPYHDLAAFKEIRRRQKEGIAIVTKPIVRSEGGKEGVDAKMAPGNASRNNPASKKKTAKGGKNNKRVASSVASGGNNKKPTTVKSEQGKKITSSAINPHQKLPFQSPKPPPNPSINGSQNPSGANAIATSNQNRPSSAVVEKLGFSWGKKPAGATGTATGKNTYSPASPRRLSPRKWKPSEKILETISMLPGKTDGSIPRGLGIQPLLPAAPSLIKSNATTGDGSAATEGSSSELAPKPLPPENSLSASTKGDIPPTQTKEPPANGGPSVPASTVAISSITGSSTSVATSGDSKEKRATDGNRVNSIIPTKVEESASNGSAKTGTAGGKTQTTNMTGQIEAAKDKVEPTQ